MPLLFRPLEVVHHHICWVPPNRTKSKFKVPGRKGYRLQFWVALKTGNWLKFDPKTGIMWYRIIMCQTSGSRTECACNAHHGYWLSHSFVTRRWFLSHCSARNVETDGYSGFEFFDSIFPGTHFPSKSNVPHCVVDGPSRTSIPEAPSSLEPAKGQRGVLQTTVPF